VAPPPRGVVLGPVGVPVGGAVLVGVGELVEDVLHVDLLRAGDAGAGGHVGDARGKGIADFDPRLDDGRDVLDGDGVVHRIVREDVGADVARGLGDRELALADGVCLGVDDDLGVGADEDGVDDGVDTGGEGVVHRRLEGDEDVGSRLQLRSPVDKEVAALVERKARRRRRNGVVGEGNAAHLRRVGDVGGVGIEGVGEVDVRKRDDAAVVHADGVEEDFARVEAAVVIEIAVEDAGLEGREGGEGEDGGPQVELRRLA
jgi:hypothetical protein